MSTALALDRPQEKASRFRPPRLIRAELLKLRKRRGVVATVTAMTIGAAVVLYGVLVALHAANPAHHGPAGGVTNLGHAVFLVVFTLLFLLWHLRPFYQRSMLSDSVHAAQHASFLVTALLFWWALLRGQGAPGRDG